MCCSSIFMAWEAQHQNLLSLSLSTSHTVSLLCIIIWKREAGSEKTNLVFSGEILVFCMDMKGYSGLMTTNDHRNEAFVSGHQHRTRRRQQQCIQQNHVASHKTSPQNHSLNLASSSSTSTSLTTTQYTISLPLFPAFIASLLLLSLISPVLSLSSSPTNQTFKPAHELFKLRRIKTLLNKINKPSVKTLKACPFLTIFYLLIIFWTTFINYLCFLFAESWWGFNRLCFISSPASFWSSYA